MRCALDTPMSDYFYAWGAAPFFKAVPHIVYFESLGNTCGFKGCLQRSLKCVMLAPPSRLTPLDGGRWYYIQQYCAVVEVCGRYTRPGEFAAHMR